MKQSLKKMLPGIILLILGSFIFFYPALSGYFTRRKELSVTVNYTELVSKTGKERLQDEKKRAEEYNRSLLPSDFAPEDPFNGGNPPSAGRYSEILNLSGDGVMAIIRIEKIGVRLPVYHGTDSETLEKGAGHLERSALPVGMKDCRAVITGHSGLKDRELFTRLDELKLGDRFEILVLDETLEYEVDGIETVLPEEMSAVRPIEGEDRVTLVTCTPYGVNSHRLLVHGKRVTDAPPTADNSSSGGNKTTSEQRFFPGGLREISAIAGALFLLLAVVMTVIMLVMGRKEE